MRERILVVAIGTALLVGGCGGGAETADSEVATLQSVPATGTTPAAEERPLVRPDASTEEYRALQSVWFACLEQHGMTLQGDPQTAQKPAPPEEYPEATAACAAKEPESWMMRDERLNPEYPDLMRAVVACLKEKGYDVSFEAEPRAKVKYGSTEDLLRADNDSIACTDRIFAERAKVYARN
ncbi:hypothetical protein ACIA8K_39450 [Catenuloplanes sp. NPDC051500]|uniref:hypothetical protein n=1 Tax=Catenuloplanes sp. NPDC051500 TaxID=3363959 RepID=UPI003790F86A